MRTKDGFTQCSKCGKQFLADHFNQHLSTHEREDFEKVEESRSNPYSSSSDFFERVPPNLDATKDVGYVVRETGRFGSPASYDGFDDESES